MARLIKALNMAVSWRIIKVLLLAATALFFVNVVFHNTQSKDSLSISKAILISVFFSEGIRLINLQINKKFTWENSPAVRFAVQFAVDVSFVLFFVLGIKMIILIHFQHMSWNRFFHQELFVNWAIIFVTLIVVLMDLGIFLIRQWRYSIIELEISKRQSAEFQFEILRSQINPHFLFNSLNTLDALIYTDAEKASAFTRHLAQIFRNILEMKNSELIPLVDEFKLAEAYIQLMSIRFGKNLQINIKVAEKCLSRFIPSLSTQIIIENAVNHNIISNQQPLQIDIYNDDFFLVIKNNIQLKAEPLRSTGIGLKNINNRYKLITNQVIVIIQKEGYFFVKLPLIREI